MAKLKPAGKRPKAKVSDARSAIPCLVVILIGIALLCVLFYFSLQSNIQ